MPSLVDTLHDEVDELEGFAEKAHSIIDDAKGVVLQAIKTELAVDESESREAAFESLAVIMRESLGVAVASALPAIRDLTTEAFDAGVSMAKRRRRAS